MIETLSLNDKFWPILALDHGLTVGHDNSVSTLELPNLLKGCKENIGSVVMTYGLARFIHNINSLPLIVQCFGAPLGYPKVQVCSVDQALSIDAQGVAVQVDFSLSEDSLRYQIENVSRLVGKAHTASLPVLFMVAPEATRDLPLLSKSVRFCIELGADLIKVRYDVLNVDKYSYSRFAEFSGGSPPLLLTGGAISQNILSEVIAARNLGFSGYCIGRNIFQAQNPLAMSRSLREAWQNSKPTK